MEEVLQNRNAADSPGRSYRVKLINAPQLLIGFNALLLGAIFYYIFRPAGNIYFIKSLGWDPQLHITMPPLLAGIGRCLPTFIHVFAFILLTAGLVAGSKKSYLIITLAWCAIDLLFEIGQGVGREIMQIIPDWFSGIPFLENTRAYFMRGSFDWYDLFSIALGSLAAYFILRLTNRKEGQT